MDRISINLLPLDLKENKKNLKQKRLINTISIGILTSLVIVSGVLVVLSILQNNQLNSEKNQLTNLENTVSSLKEKEAAVIILKKRISDISQIRNQKYPQADSFKLTTSLLPENVSIQGLSTDAASLQKFFDNLTDPKINEGKITKTVITNLNRGSSPQLGFDLEINTKTE
jgi:Tfp pilus assembly protein PilN